MQRALNYAFKTVKAVTLFGQREKPSSKLTLGLSDFLMWNRFKGKVRTFAIRKMYCNSASVGESLLMSLKDWLQMELRSNA